MIETVTLAEKNGYIDFDERETVLTVPALMLTNHCTACAAESFVSYFKITGRAKIVGITIFGSGAEALIRDLPFGGKNVACNNLQQTYRRQRIC